MPGPVSDSYDPEWGTAENADLVRGFLNKVRDRLTSVLGTAETQNIVEVLRRSNKGVYNMPLCEQEIRLLRFAISRALETF